MEEALKPLVDTGTQFVKNPKNQCAALVAGAAYLLTKNEGDKLRNAAIAGIAAELFLPAVKTPAPKGSLKNGKE